MRGTLWLTRTALLLALYGCVAGTAGEGFEPGESTNAGSGGNVAKGSGGSSGGRAPKGSGGGNAGSSPLGTGGSKSGSGGTENSSGGSTMSSGGTAGSAGSGGGATGGTSQGSGGSGGTNAGGSGGSGPISQTKMRTVVYLPDYRGKLSGWASKLDFARITHVNVCFAAVDADGNLSYSDETLKEFVNAAHAAQVKVGIAFGGAPTINNPGVFAALVNPENRGKFSDKILAFLEANGLDGVDVDLEGNSVDGNYEGFARTLKEKLAGRGKFVTAAAAEWFANRVPASAFEPFDFINIMSYDLCWHGTKDPCDIDSYDRAKQELDWWVNTRKLPRDKAVFGVPFYGRRWRVDRADQGENNGYGLMYSEIQQMYASAAKTDVFISGAYVIHHNTRETIQRKARLAKDYGGIMIWEIGQDVTGSGSLLKAISEAN